eukprot:TRINITY_DN18581_c0_g1_i1.p1 TRINITY_DN18581_c0_g1~~TRINITY_DN18581_c0_g1_i1.p1  ORF type:complete len:447 (+),score=92.30 TRINITY_DN18581_c0_g1_i1:96-1436(+)
MRSALSESMKQKFKVRYKELDTNHDGSLDFAELSVLLRKGNPLMPEAEIQALFTHVDKDSSGTVEFEEFVDYIFGQEAKKNLLPPTKDSNKARRPRSSSSATSQGSRKSLSSTPQMKKRASSVGSSRKSQESWDAMSDGQVSASQGRALQDLAKWLAHDRLSMPQLIEKLLDNVRHRKEGGRAFTKEQTEATTLEILIQKFPHVELDKLGEATLGKGSELLPAVADAAMSVVLELGKKAGVAFEDIAGQVLFRYRLSEPLQQECYKGLIEDLRWVLDAGTDKNPSIVEMSSMTFKELTMRDGGKMYFRTWQKLVELVRRNPILQERFKRSDADRVWHEYSRDAVRSEMSAGACVKIKDFPRMLLSVSHEAGVHPWIIFMAVGCHCDDLATRREEGLELVTMRGSTPPVSKSPAEPAAGQPVEPAADEGTKQEELHDLERGWNQYER